MSPHKGLMPMSGREFFFLWMGLMIGLAARRKGRQPSPWDAERRRQFRTALVSIASSMLLGAAAAAACSDLYLLYRLTFLRDRLEHVLFLLIPGLAALSALFWWVGLRLLSFATRTCPPDGMKPKLARHAHELD
jgi:hypothetical protein